MNPNIYIHGSKLKRKASEDSAADLVKALGYYNDWRAKTLHITERKHSDINLLVKYLNEYKDLAEPIFDSRENSAQEVLQPSILEEFFEYLFCNIDSAVGTTVGVREPSHGYIDLAFNPKDLSELMTKPSFTVRRKDHDFIIGTRLQLHLKVISGTTGMTKITAEINDQHEDIVVPAIAIECKRYLERNMLDECAGTAEKVKSATPYCLYFVVAEYLKMDEGSPELTKIDEVFVLRKQRNSDRSAPGFVAKPICPELICEIFDLSVKHLRRVWWNPNSALTTGKLFG